MGTESNRNNDNGTTTGIPNKDTSTSSSNSSSSNSRVELVVSLLVAFLIALAVALIVLLTLQSYNKGHRMVQKAEHVQHSEVALAALSYKLRDVTGITNILYGTVVALILGGDTILPPHLSANKTERMLKINDTVFTHIAQHSFKSVPSLITLQLQPSGVITQVYPPGSAPVGLDLLNHPTQRPDVLASMQHEEVVISGPLTLVQGGLGMIVRKSLSIAPAGTTNSNNSSASSSFDTWWGSVVGIVDVPQFVRSTNIAKHLSTHAMYTHWELTCNTTDTGEEVVIGNSSTAGARILREQSEDAIVHCRLLFNQQSWCIHIIPTAGWHALTPSAAQIALTLFLAVFCPLILSQVIRILANVLRRKRQFDVTRAPTHVPFYAVMASVHGSTRLWEKHPDLMTEFVVPKYTSRIGKAISKHRGYCAVLSGDSTVAVFSTAVQALSFSLDVQQEIGKGKWPPELLEGGGDDHTQQEKEGGEPTGGFLPLVITAHLVRKCEIDIGEHEEVTYREGDITFLSRLHRRCSPGVVSASSYLARGEDLPEFSFTKGRSFKMSGLRSEQAVYHVTTLKQTEEEAKATSSAAAFVPILRGAGDSKNSSQRGDSKNSSTAGGEQRPSSTPVTSSGGGAELDVQAVHQIESGNFESSTSGSHSSNSTTSQQQQQHVLLLGRPQPQFPELEGSTSRRFSSATTSTPGETNAAAAATSSSSSSLPLLVVRPERERLDALRRQASVPSSVKAAFDNTGFDTIDLEFPVVADLFVEFYHAYNILFSTLPPQDRRTITAKLAGILGVPASSIDAYLAIRFVPLYLYRLEKEKLVSLKESDQQQGQQGTDAALAAEQQHQHHQHHQHNHHKNGARRPSASSQQQQQQQQQQQGEQEKSTENLGLIQVKPMAHQ